MSTSADSLDHWVKYLDGEVAALNALNVSRRPTTEAGHTQVLKESAKDVTKRRWADFYNY